MHIFESASGQLSPISRRKSRPYMHRVRLRVTKGLRNRTIFLPLVLVTQFPSPEGTIISSFLRVLLEYSVPLTTHTHTHTYAEA